MRDIDHPHPLLFQRAKGFEQTLNLISRQRGRGFIQHQKIAVHRQRASNRHQRFLGAGQILHAGRRVKITAHLRQRLAGELLDLALADHAGLTRISQRQRHVFSHGHPLDHAKVLVDESH